MENCFPILTADGVQTTCATLSGRQVARKKKKNANDFRAKEDLVDCEEATFDFEDLSSGKATCIRRAIKIMNPPVVQAARAQPFADATAIAALVAASAPKPVAKVSVDISTALQKCDLGDLDVSTWPASSLVDMLANCPKGVSARNIFTYTDLAKHAMPPWVVDTSAVSDDEAEVDKEASTANIEQLANVLTKATKPAKRLATMHQWAAAYNRWAYAAAAAGQLTLGAALSHLDNCFRVSEEARSRGKPAALAIAYDEVARKTWAVRSRSNYPGFSIKDVCKSIDKDILALAESLFEARGKQMLAKKQGKDQWSNKKFDEHSYVSSCWHKRKHDHHGNGGGTWGNKRYRH